MTPTTKPLRMRIHGPNGVRLELDRTQVFPDDPGNGTPALVILIIQDHPGHGHVEATATLNCALGEGEVDGGRAGMFSLSTAQMEWLAKQQDHSEKFLYSE